MKSAARHPLLIGLSITVLLGSLGCAATRPASIALPPPLSERERTTLGTVGIVSARFTPAALFRTPAKGSEAGAELVAAFCSGEGKPSHSIEDDLALYPITYLFTIPAIVGIGFARTIAGVVGGVLAEPAAKVEEGEVILRNAVGTLKIQETMRNRVLQVAREQTHHHFVLLEDQGPAVRNKEATYRLPRQVISAGSAGETRQRVKQQHKDPETVSERIDRLLGIDPVRADRWMALQKEDMNESITINLPPTPPATILKVAHVSASQGMDAILEISVREVGLIGEGCINPPLALFVTVRTRLIRLADGTVPYAQTFEYRTKERTFAEWASNNAQSFREELDRAHQRLAADIVAQLFGTVASHQVAVK